ncbi:MAG TPA: calcium-translocating P-type ATPase, PMCA-type [Candidatus Aphodocola excrementigallinarum]|uniref:P-type Ca(2+) transporter n=1 Tax=Candidatus Aphodocola excrementigallinarum TaxID=2840670 RepID=A0A9D1IMC4_9FIRM|nr:calcium-translocating P-type ATPase, PMCA-type [Candidatus Aphodocola excrementigallinarum]
MNKYNLNGLTTKKAEENRKLYGSNEIKKTKTNTFLSLLIESLGDPIIKILLIALAIKLVFLFKDFDWFETLGILIAIFLASFISTISEYGSEKAFNKLQEETSKLKCKAKRDGKITLIGVDEVVKDDIIYLESGDKVPADGIIVKGDVSVDESTINGESKEAHKESVKKSNVEEKNKLYKGTTIYTGTCVMLTLKVGADTFYGKIADELKEKPGESPLRKRLRDLAKLISTFGYVGAFLASTSYLFSVIVVDNGFSLDRIIDTVSNFRLMMDYLIYAMTLAVTIIIVSVPEGLPMMITLVLSSNMRRMLKNNVLVRKMVGIETAGNINILFSDKTGTITTGKLVCNKIIDGSLNEYKKESDLKDDNYSKILKTSMVVNNQSMYDNDKVIAGNSTDRALLSFFKPFKVIGVKKIKQVPFDSKNKYMITVIDDLKIKNLIKGAPEKILPNCKYYFDKTGKKSLFLNKNRLERIIKEETKKGIRVIVLATSNTALETFFKDLVFVGAIFIKDPVRKEARKAIDLTQKAGIQTVMITGDNKDTAQQIAKEVGLIKEDKDLVITSNELNEMSDVELKKILLNLRVVARSLPQDKSRLIRVSKEMNLVTGMTGDGVNDAPALKRADVGFAMGSGSEVAKEASDIVILDNNFLSISKAVLFGRTIFKSIRKFIIFQLTVNLCALSISIIGPFIGVDTPVTVIQMLWINMVMDTLAALAFAFEPPLKEYMYEKPKKKDEKIMNSYMVSEILITGFYTTILCVLFLKVPFIKNLFLSNESFMTAFFGLFIFAGLFNSFSAHTSRINILAHILKNKMFIVIMAFIVIVQIMLMYYGGEMFRTVPLTLKEFLIMILFAISVVPVDIIRKIMCKKYGKKRSV